MQDVDINKVHSIQHKKDHTKDQNISEQIHVFRIIVD
jgi:hypothetical protein